jgi:hypothetical protein
MGQNSVQILGHFSVLSNTLDVKVAENLVGLSRKSGSNGMVNLREINWELALDTATGMDNVYADHAGQTYLSRWEFGLGVSATGEKNRVWYDQREVEPHSYKVTGGGIGSLLCNCFGLRGLVHPKSCTILRNDNLTRGLLNDPILRHPLHLRHQSQLCETGPSRQ